MRAAPRIGFRGLVAAATLVIGCGGEPDAPPDARSMIQARTLGLAYLEENRLDEAEAEFRRLVELAPSEPLGHANLGLVYLRRGRFAEAEAELTRALELSPEDPDARLILFEVLKAQERLDDARAVLSGSLEAEPDHRKTLFALAELAGERGDTLTRRSSLARLVELDPANLAARLRLAEVDARSGDAIAVAVHLEAVRQQVPELPVQARDVFDDALAAARAGSAEEALPPLLGFHNAMRTTPAYQAGLADLRGPGGVLLGFPLVTFANAVAGEAPDPETVAASIVFTDIGEQVGLTNGGAADGATALAVADYDGDGDPDVLAGPGRLYRNDLATFTEVGSDAGVPGGAASDARFADFDNDGLLDLLLTRAGGDALLRNDGDGRFSDVTRSSEVGATRAAGEALFVDADHDGDLDIFLPGSGASRLLRNNLDGTFTERAAAMGASLDGLGAHQAVFADFDDDDDIDLFVATDGGGVLLDNRRGSFEPRTPEAATAGARVVAAADYNNDGWVDLFLGGSSGSAPVLLLNDEGSGFQRDERPTALLGALSDVAVTDALFVDYDNDGWQDLAVTTGPGEGGGVRLFRNAAPGRFDDASATLPALGPQARLATADFGSDGDPDLFVTDPEGRVRLLRNDGGDANHHLRVQLVGLTTGSGKNNHFGIGAKLEVRAGALYQVRFVTDVTTIIGIGARARADVVRIRWTNGVPQNLFYPGADQALVEEQILKGSCAFLYVWNGTRYEFVGDVMWRSALGMPVGIMAGGDKAYAPAYPSEEYVRIPPGALRPRDGQYVIQLTEELWETAYLDEVELVAVDHPASVDVFVDEAFRPPVPTQLRIEPVGERRAPVAATDRRGRDVLASIAEPDFRYVADLEPSRYQGTTEPHHLTLDFGDVPDGERLRLFLRGWIYPTDASINVALAQQSSLTVDPPRLEVPDGRGGWVVAIPDVGFPSGKDKTVILDLTGRFPSADRRVRVASSMEIYWDHAFLAVGDPRSELRTTRMAPSAADLHERGFSRMYRRGGRFGPHWFDYDDVSTEWPWRPLRGSFTRFGDVLPLLDEADDRSVVYAPGEEVTVRFDAASLPELPDGWTRDFMIYTSGWIKDADLNTALGASSEPLPWKAMSSYPPAYGERYPDERLADYLRTYQTRTLDVAEPLRPSGPSPRRR